MPCGCKVTGHEPNCWLSHSGYYVNGVKVAPLYVYVPVVVQFGGTGAINWPER
jgi:hypothetical protein